MSTPSHAPQDRGAGDDARWAPGPSEPRLARAAVHVWRADLGMVGDDVTASLNDEERQRAARIVGERDRRLWSRSRGVLRALLGRYIGVGAGDVELTAGRHGKPELDGGRRQELFFNLSHSRNLALYAFASDGPLGVDIQARRDEHARAGVDHIGLARRAFGEHEAQRLSLVGPDRREWEFLRAWTCHEAELKRLGTGIGAGRHEDGRADDASAAEQPAGAPAAPAMVELNVGPEAVAALALARSPYELHRWAWA